MWTAQTYLGAHVGKAKYFLYLLVEDYISVQEDFGRAVIANLRQLGMRTGDASAIFVPDDCARDHINMELRDLFTDNLMKEIYSKTPGILFTDKNLSDLNPKDDRWVFLSLSTFMSPSPSQQLGDFFTRMEKAIGDSDDLLDAMTGPKWKPFWDWAKSRFMFEPNFYGVGMRGRKGRPKVVISANLD